MSDTKSTSEHVRIKNELDREIETCNGRKARRVITHGRHRGQWRLRSSLAGYAPC